MASPDDVMSALHRGDALMQKYVSITKMGAEALLYPGVVVGVAVEACADLIVLTALEGADLEDVFTRVRARVKELEG